MWADASSWVRSMAARLGLACQMERRRHWILLERVEFTVSGDPHAVLRFARAYNAAIDAYNSE